METGIGRASRELVSEMSSASSPLRGSAARARGSQDGTGTGEESAARAGGGRGAGGRGHCQRCLLPGLGVFPFLNPQPPPHGGSGHTPCMYDLYDMYDMHDMPARGCVDVSSEPCVRTGRTRGFARSSHFCTFYTTAA